MASARTTSFFGEQKPRRSGIWHSANARITRSPVPVIRAVRCQHWTVDTEGAVSRRSAASVPEVTAVGGTRFDEKPGVEYWNSKEGPGRASARSYIPEKAWNDTDVKGTLAASGGGTSALYPKPVWQTAPGVPNGNMRHVPDISFTASWFHDPYMVFIDGVIKGGGGTSGWHALLRRWSPCSISM